MMQKSYSLLIGSTLALLYVVAVVNAQTQSHTPPPAANQARYYYEQHDGVMPPVPVHASGQNPANQYYYHQDDDSLPPPPPGQNGASTTPNNLGARLRADYQQRLDNAKNNQTYRNDVLDAHYSSSTMPRLGPGGRPLPPVGTSTSPFGDDNGRPGMPKDPGELRRYISTRFNGARNELQTALKNLQQIRGRINSRLQKMQQNGTDVSTAQNLLTIADAKIATAEQLVSAFASNNPASTTPITATTTPNLDPSRQAMTAATKAVMDARKALTDVVNAMMKLASLNSPSGDTQP